jgi:predicted CDP-diglyceride synthetase/phosphatidate cytidylyltransferase
MNAVYLAALIALFFAGGMMFQRRDWSYGGNKYDRKETRQTGWFIFIVIFVVVLVMSNWNS